MATIGCQAAGSRSRPSSVATASLQRGEPGSRTVAGIARIAAGTYPIGFFDINSLAKFLDQNPDKKVQAVLMMYDNPAFAIASVAKTGINNGAGYLARATHVDRAIDSIRTLALKRVIPIKYWPEEAKAKAEGRYKGRPANTKRNAGIAHMLRTGASWTAIQGSFKCSRATVAKIAKGLRQAG